MTLLSEVRSSRELLVNLTLREVRGKYKRTALGQLWSLLNPLATLLIYTVVFAFVFRIAPPVGQPSGLHAYALWLVCGLLAFNFFNNALTSGMGALLGNANLVKKVYFPRHTLVTAAVLSWLVTFASELAVLVAVLLLFGGMPLPFLPLLVVAAVVLMLFTVGLALALSVLNVYFRDTQHFVSIGMQILFYATPILYPVSLVHDAAQRLHDQGFAVLGWHPPVLFLYELNPLGRFVDVFRVLLYDNRLPDLVDTLYCLASTAVALVLGFTVYQRYEGRLAEEL